MSVAAIRLSAFIGSALLKGQNKPFLGDIQVQNQCICSIYQQRQSCSSSSVPSRRRLEGVQKVEHDWWVLRFSRLV